MDAKVIRVYTEDHIYHGIFIGTFDEEIWVRVSRWIIVRVPLVDVVDVV